MRIKSKAFKIFYPYSALSGKLVQIESTLFYTVNQWFSNCVHSAVATGGPRGPCPPACFPHLSLLNTFLEHHVTTRQPTMMEKGIVTFSPTYLNKVTYISSILKFSNSSESLVIEVSNTSFDIQSLHLGTISSSSIIFLVISISKPRTFASYTIQSILSPKPLFLKPRVGMHIRLLSVYGQWPN